jgi:hypothetical protein
MSRNVALILGSLAFVFASPSMAAVPCTNGFGDACFVFVAGSQDEPTAEQVCQSQFGGHLASIHSLAEDNFISHVVDPTATGGITAWIGGIAPGGFCAGPSATYAWTDGSPWNFQNWRTSTGEPNCSGAPGCIQFWPNTNGTLSGWNDVPCSASLDGFVCEFYRTPAPTVSPLGLVVLVGLLATVGALAVRRAGSRV